MSSNQSIINVRIAFLAIVMVTWGVVEFALHTLRPNTIEREDHIVSVFKETSDTIWESHKELQLITSNLSNVLLNVDASTYQDIIQESANNLDNTSDWLLVRDGVAQWWSDNLSRNVVEAMLNATSVLHSNENGVFVIASSKWTTTNSSWQLLGSTKIFDISVSNSKYGDVYEASIPTLTRMNPVPFYLEGSPDLLPFDHRFSIIRINENFTTGHLALSTLDPGVRNYVDPIWTYGLRTLFFFVVALSAWSILNLLVSDRSESFKLASRIAFILICGWITVLLDIIKYWSGLNTADILFDGINLTPGLVHFGWATFIFVLAARYMLLHFSKERFFDHGTRFNKTSLILFTVGSFIGTLFWLILLYHNELYALLRVHEIEHNFSNFRIELVGFLWFILVASTFRLIGGLLHFVQKSVKYQVNWILQILITGHIYLFTILFILEYSSGDVDLIKTGWTLTTLPIGIWILQKLLNSDPIEDSIFMQSLRLSTFPVLVAFPLYLHESIELIQIIQIIPAIIGIWIKSFAGSLVVVSVTSINASQSPDLLKWNLNQLFKGHHESRLTLTTFLLILGYFVSTPLAQNVTKSQLEQSYSHFLFNQSNQYPVQGSYEPGLIRLPVFESWMVSEKPDFDDLLDFQVYSSTLNNTSSNTLKWTVSNENSSILLRLYKASESDPSPENYRILATTVDSYPRIFDRLSAIISSISILAVFSFHFIIGIVGNRSRSKNVSTI